MAFSGTATSTRAVPLAGWGSHAARVVERNALVYRRVWPVLASGLFEPVFYLFALGVGLGSLVGTVEGPGGMAVTYPQFVAPALLAASAMNGALYDATFGVFFKLKYAKTYEAILATPLGVGDVALGEICWALLRGGIYSGVFLAVMVVFGYTLSPLAVFAWPIALLIGFAFASSGMAASSFIRTFQDFDFVQMVMLPLFLFSATFYPLDTYPPALQVVVWLTPLYHGVDLMRAVTTGVIEPVFAVHIAYLVAMSAFGLRVSRRRLTKLLKP